MKEIPENTNQQMSDYFSLYQKSVLNYIYYKIYNREDAEDLSQDTFLRLMNYQKMLRPDTVRYFIFTVAKNLVNDYLRRHYKKHEYESFIKEEYTISCDDTESTVIAKDIGEVEQKRLVALPEQRRRIYSMSRYDEIPSADIANQLNLSKRTVENHLFISRKEMREHIRKCI